MNRVIISTATASTLLLGSLAIAQTQTAEPEATPPTRTATATPAAPAPSAPAPENTGAPEDNTTPADAEEDRALLPEDGDEDRTMLPEDADDDEEEDKTATGEDEPPANNLGQPLRGHPIDASRAAHAVNDTALEPGVGSDNRISLIETGRKYL